MIFRTVIKNTKSQRIALIGYSLHGGGLERSMAEVSQMLAALGHEVHLVILGGKVSYPYSGNLQHFDLKKGTSFLKRVQTYLQLRNWLRKHRIERVIDFRYRLNLLMEVLFLQYIYNCPLIYTVHSERLESYIPRHTLFRNYLRKFDITWVCVSKHLTERVKSIFPNHRVKCIYNSLDLEHISVQKLEKISVVTPYILYVGRLNFTVKQVDKILQAYQQSKAPHLGIQLIFLGEGLDDKLLRSLIVKSPFASQIRIVPYVENPYPYYFNAFLTLLASKHEGFGRTLLESLACGTPVISFAIPGPTEVIENEMNGLLVEPQNFTSFTQAINRFVEDPTFHAACRLQTDSGLDHYSFEQISLHWQELIDSL